MREKIRKTPVIPDHEVLRKIGGGSYGDVWMARTVTGMMRAVKVVWRSDFDTDEEFEREFEGIKKYEPISRNHDGLIPILHVGRSVRNNEDFYYYVMELADDQERGQSFHPVEYTPRTLRSELLEANKQPIDIDACLEVGVDTAEALMFLHGKDLAHRDIKPSNIVYHSGRAKLADIGLVAAPGQMTFVGTQGFVPPEGPGTRRADIYALGKILYEMTTGMDRMDFPLLPECPFKLEKAKRWRALNEILCDVCDPREPARTLKRADDLKAALTKIKGGQNYRKKQKWHRPALLLATAAAVVVASFLLIPWEQGKPDVGGEPDPVVMVPVKITSTPVGAEVWSEDGRLLGVTPLASKEMVKGDVRRFEFRLKGYATTSIELEVEAPATFMDATLPIFSPPIVGKPWSDYLGVGYKPEGKNHVSRAVVSFWAIKRFTKDVNVKGLKLEPYKNKKKPRTLVALANQKSAQAYCYWLTENSISRGYLTDEFEIVPDFELRQGSVDYGDGELRPFHCVVKKIPFASIRMPIEQGLNVAFAIDGEAVDYEVKDGAVVISRVMPGSRRLLIEPEGYRRYSIVIDIAENEQKEVKLDLQTNNSVIFDQKWENSLGMVFQPINSSLMASIYETRVKDYIRFCIETKRAKPKEVRFKRNENHPVINVSRNDAIDFCAWLTKKERGEFLIGRTHQYRLPSDAEWSMIAGMEVEEGETPFERESGDSVLFAWGDEWLPEDLSANLADAISVNYEENVKNRRIHNYFDNHDFTAPVGQYLESKLGLYDITGNVFEWVNTDFGAGDYGVARGGSWRSYQRDNIYLKYRSIINPQTKSDEIGFRVVLSKSE